MSLPNSHIIYNKIKYNMCSIQPMTVYLCPFTQSTEGSHSLVYFYMEFHTKKSIKKKVIYKYVSILTNKLVENGTDVKSQKIVKSE